MTEARIIHNGILRYDIVPNNVAKPLLLQEIKIKTRKIFRKGVLRRYEGPPCLI